MPVNINGSTGIDTPGLASDGMPTSGGDPVVESGSNSDGEWTRFADGTQVCRISESVDNANLGDGSTSAGTYYSVMMTAQFPIAFVDGGATVSFSASITRADSPYCSHNGVSSTGLDYFVAQCRQPNTENAQVFITATGRYK